MCGVWGLGLSLEFRVNFMVWDLGFVIRRSSFRATSLAGVFRCVICLSERTCAAEVCMCGNIPIPLLSCQHVFQQDPLHSMHSLKSSEGYTL